MNGFQILHSCELLRTLLCVSSSWSLHFIVLMLLSKGINGPGCYISHLSAFLSKHHFLSEILVNTEALTLHKGQSIALSA